MLKTSIVPIAINAGAGPDNMQGTADDLPIGPNGCGASGSDNCDFFEIPTAGGNRGKKTFLFISKLPEDVDGDGVPDINQEGPGSEVDIVIELVSTNDEFVTGTTELSTAPAAILSSAFFDSPTGTTGFGALAFIVVRTGNAIIDVHAPTSGTLTMTAIDVNGDTRNTLIQGTLGTTDLSRTDGVTIGGCNTILEGVSFTLKQGNPNEMRTYTGIRSFVRGP
jgi:hypothetical protein